jgi:hypothetical protein
VLLQISSPGRGDDDRGAAYLFRTFNGSSWYARVRLTALDGSLEVRQSYLCVHGRAPEDNQQLHPQPPPHTLRLGVGPAGPAGPPPHPTPRHSFLTLTFAVQPVLRPQLVCCAHDAETLTWYCSQDRFGTAVAMGTDRAIVTTSRFNFFSGAVYQVGWCTRSLCVVGGGGMAACFNVGVLHSVFANSHPWAPYCMTSRSLALH